jgi:hypothetical protein
MALRAWACGRMSDRVTLTEAKALGTLSGDERACLALLSGGGRFMAATTYAVPASETFLKPHLWRAENSCKIVTVASGVVAGVDYDALSHREGLKSGPLLWGEFVAFPWIIRHTPEPKRKADPAIEYSYLRIYFRRSTVQVTPLYILQGVEVSRGEYETYCKAGAKVATKAAAIPDIAVEPTLTRVIRFDHIRAINGASFTSH